MREENHHGAARRETYEAAARRDARRSLLKAAACLVCLAIWFWCFRDLVKTDRERHAEVMTRLDAIELRVEVGEARVLAAQRERTVVRDPPLPLVARPLGRPPLAAGKPSAVHRVAVHPDCLIAAPAK